MIERFPGLKQAGEVERMTYIYDSNLFHSAWQKLKGGKPPKKAPGGDAQKALEEQVYNIMMGNN